MTLQRIFYVHWRARCASARHRAGATAAVGLAAAFLACSDAGPEPLALDTTPGTDQSYRIQVTNDGPTLDQRVRITEDTLSIVPVPGGMQGAAAASLAMPAGEDQITLVLLAEVDPPAVNETTIQATHITMYGGDKAYVSYNVQGPVYRGGIDVFNVGNEDRPKLISQALFEDTDISAVDYKAGYLYLATATGDGGFASPAVLEEIMLDRGRLTAFSRRVDVPSYAATGVWAAREQVLVTSGDGADGGLSILSRTTLELESMVSFRDARAVAVDGNVAVAMKGTPGGLYVVKRTTGQVLATWEPGGANIPESKSTIEIHGNLVLMAAGDEGTKVVSLQDGQVVAQLPAPIVQGIAPELTVTNAVTARGNLVFMANGAAGLYVARMTVSVDGNAADLELVGKVAFSDGPSTNFALARGNVLFVATGLGGLKIVRIEGLPDDDEE